MAQDVAPPLAAGRYRLVSVLGEGGMATVYSAYDERLGVTRAVKLLTPALSHHSGLRRRFETEAKTTARLHHKHIVTVHDVGTDGDRTFMVLELVGGGSLMARLDALGPMPPRMASEVMQAILTALQYAHEHGVIHRDIKPHNILIDLDGTPKLTDFGIARVIASDQSLTRTGAAIGTPAYMAPEQRGNASSVDARADLFSAGATLYTLVTGREPYDLYARELHDQLFSDVPGPLGAVIRNATRYSPDERYATAAAMLADLRAISVGLDADPPEVLPLGAPLPTRSAVARLRGPETADEGDMASERLDSGETHPDDARAVSMSGATVAPPLDDTADGFDIEVELPEKPEGLGGVLRSGRFWALVSLGVLAAGAVVAVLVADETRNATASGPVSSATRGAAAVAPVASPAPVASLAATAPPAAATPSPDEPPASSPAPAVAAPETAHSTAPRPAPTTEAPAPVAASPSPIPAAAAAEASSSHLGTLTVSSKPKADVFLNDRYQGRTKLRADLKPGTYHVVLESEQNGQTAVDLTVRPDEETVYCWDFKAAATCAH